MRLFSEKVTPIFTSSNINILTVKDYEEVFFDVYEFEINGKTFVAEKIASHNSKPVVSVPIVIDKEEFKAPFVLEQGSFKVEFNKNIKEFIGSTEINLPEQEVIQEDIDPVINTEQDKDTQQQDLVIEEVVFNENNKKIVSNIQETNDKEEKLRLYVKDTNVKTLKEVDTKIANIHEITINDVRSELEKSEQDFLYINEEIKKLTKKSGFFKTTASRELKDVKSDIVKLKVEKGELEQRILESKELLEDSVKKLAKINEDKVQENKYYLQKEVDKLQEKTQFYSDKANKNNLKNDKEIHTFKESISKELDKTKEFLSKEVKVIDITLKEDLISNIDSKLEVTNKEIDEFLTEGLEKVDSNLKEKLTVKILESKTQFEERVDELKKSIPDLIEKELTTESKGLPTKDFKIEFSKLERRLADRFSNELNQVRKYMDMYGGGGGTGGSIVTGGEIAGNLLPTENSEYSLGSADKRWKDLFISGDTIDIGGTKLKIVDNALRVEDETDNDASIAVQNLSASNVILSGGRDLVDIFATSAEAGINTVNAGAGLTGGGSSSSVTLNAGEGDGIDVSADSIAVDNTVLRTTGASAVGLSATSTTNGFVSAGRDLADIFAPTSTIITRSGLSDFGVIDSFSVATQSSGKYAIAVVDSTGGTQFSEISITTDGTTIGVVEYGINSTTPECFVEYGAIVNSGTVTLTAKGVGASVISNFTFKGNRLNLF